METSDQQNLTPVRATQISLLNTVPFTIDGIIQPLDVLAPLVSVEPQVKANVKSLNIKIVVFVSTPLGTPFWNLYLDSDAGPNELKLVLNYRSSEKDVTAYQPWYISYDYAIDPADSPILTVNTILENIEDQVGNPRTKRGTVTHVLES